MIALGSYYHVSLKIIYQNQMLTFPRGVILSLLQ